MTESGNSKSGGPESGQAQDTPVKSVLSIALIGPDDKRRIEFLNLLNGRPGTDLHEFVSFPPDLNDLPQSLANKYDVVILDVDSNPDFIYELVVRISAFGQASVMVYSADADVKQAVRFMRAGARDYFSLPLVAKELEAALVRAATVQRAAPANAKEAVGKVMVFLGSKGGCGVTSIASNFAMSAAQLSGQGTLLIDFGSPLGDTAINLGMVANYSTANALRDPSRLDANFLSSLLSRHTSGLSVLAAPGDFPPEQPSIEAIDKLMTVARQNFSFIVVDVGSRIDMMPSTLFDESSTVYLITQVGITELRNANRMINQFFALRNRSLQIVLNRYTPKTLLFDDKQISNALTRPADWKIPDDWSTARRTQNTATPIALEDSPISQAIRKMARAACGLGDEKPKKKSFSLFGK